MKKIILFLLLINPSLIFAQKISIPDLMSMRLKSPEDIEDFMITEKWSLISTEVVSHTARDINFFNSEKIGSLRYNTFFTFSYHNDQPISNSHRYNIILLKFENLDTYKSYLDEMQELSFEQVKYEVFTNRIERHYKSTNGDNFFILARKVGNGVTTKHELTVYPPDLYSEYMTLRENNNNFDGYD